MFIINPVSLRKEYESQANAIQYLKNLPLNAIEGVTLEDFEQEEEVMLEGPMLDTFQARGGIVPWQVRREREKNYEAFLTDLNRQERQRRNNNSKKGNN